MVKGSFLCLKLQRAFSLTRLIVFLTFLLLWQNTMTYGNPRKSSFWLWIQRDGGRSRKLKDLSSPPHVCVWVCMCVHMSSCIRGQRTCCGSQFIQLRMSQGSNSGHWRQVSLPPEPFSGPALKFYMLNKLTDWWQRKAELRVFKFLPLLSLQ